MTPISPPISYARAPLAAPRCDGRVPAYSELYAAFCKPGLRDLLALCKLDVTYDRAQGDTLFLASGAEARPIAVTDFLGGYGSTILGHNRAEIKEAIVEALQNDCVIHAQASIRGRAALFGAKINELLRARDPQSKKYYAHLLNSGTEAVEAAMKHALMEWNAKRARVLQGLERLEGRFRAKGESSGELELLPKRMAAVRAAVPVFVALKGSFHGKTAGSLAVTANASYRDMYATSAVRTLFMSLDASAADVEALFKAHRLDSGTRTFSTLAGVLVEPVQGEGGIRRLTQELVASLQAHAGTDDVPLIVDEIQSGLYRTGTLLASHSLGLVPDYILLGKGLGGGIAKVSALLVSKTRYEEDFGIKHTSTFAEDDLSSTAALRSLELLEQEAIGIEERAKWFERVVKTRLGALKEKYPGVIRDVRGVGFMLGVEIDSSFADTASHFYDAIAKTDYLAYVFASFLLHRHQLRVGVTLNQSTTIRLEPSAWISKAAVENLVAGFEDLVQKIHEGRVYEIIRHLIPGSDSPLITPDAAPTPIEPLRSPPRSYLTSRAGVRRVSFLCHIVDEDHLRSLDPSFERMSKEERAYFLEQLGPMGKSMLCHQQLLRGANGQEILFELQGIISGSRFFERALRKGGPEASEKVREAYGRAVERGATHVGLGQYTSIVTKNGTQLPVSGAHVTTGNSYTIAIALKGLKKLVKNRGQNLADMHVGIVGVAGNICNVYAQIIADYVREMTVVHREPLEKSTRFQSAVRDILWNSRLDSENLHATSDFSALEHCDAVVLGTNSAAPLLFPEHLKHGALVLDISVPSNVDRSVYQERPDVECVMGGFARLPLGQALDTKVVFTPPGETFACMAETMTLGLLDHPGSYSIGDLSKPKVLKISRMAREVGIDLGSVKRVSVF